MRKVELEIIALSHSVAQSNNFAVILQEQGGVRRLPIVIGGFEAQAIAVAMERMVPNRPLTHDLFKNTLDVFNIELKEIIVNNLLEGVFYARLVCLKDGDVFEIDSRTSDALALAVRFNCPIYTYEFILDAAGVVMDDGDEAGKAQKKEKKAIRNSNSLSQYSIDELNTMLDEVLTNENYERAAEIRDEIKKRQGKES